MSGLIADRRLYLTHDLARLVEHGDPAGAILFTTPGTEVPATEAERYGLTADADGKLVLPAAVSSAEEPAGDEASEEAGESAADGEASPRRGRRRSGAGDA